MMKPKRLNSTKAKRDPRGKKDRNDRKQFVTTAEMRRKVEALVSVGYSRAEIASLLINPNTAKPINVATLESHFAAELMVGKIKTSGVVVETLYRMAIGNPTIRDAEGRVLLEERAPDMKAIQMWLKKTMGWGDEEAQAPITGPLVVFEV